jgi:hypothetical protein
MRWLRFLVPAAMAVSGCASRGLLVAPGAAGIVRESGKGGKSLSYYAADPFPAEATVSFIRKNLAEDGWKPVLGKALDQYEHSSLESGWTDLPGTRVPLAGRIWSARWIDSRGNEVVYTLSYMSPQAEQGMQPTHVSVAARYRDKATARRIQADIRQKMDSMKRPVAPR